MLSYLILLLFAVACSVAGERPSNAAAAAFYQSGRIDEALAVLRQLMDAQNEVPDPQTHFLLGAALNAKGDDTQAIRQYHTAMQLDPTLQYSSWYNIGVIHRHQKQYELALQAFTKAIAVRPECPLTLNNIGLMHHFQSQHEQAVPFFSRGLKFSLLQQSTTTKHNIVAAEIYFNMGVTLSRLQRIHQAETAYRGATEAAKFGSDLWVSATLNLAALCTFCD